MRFNCIFLFSFLSLVVISCNTKEYDSTQQQGYSLFSLSDDLYFYHFAPTSFIMDGQNRKAIAGESLDDVELAARLGFKLIEANIWRTSDGHYVCIHGSNGTFGPIVKSINNSVITTDNLRNTMISSVSLDWIKSYVRYDSDYERYQTTIPSLEEFCEACKQKNVGILAGVGGDRKAVEICIKYLVDNVIVYGPPTDIRDYFNGYVLTWNNTSGTSKESLLSQAHSFGQPYICGLGSQVISELVHLNELDRLIETMHNYGYLVGWASVYSQELDSMKYLNMGMDISASGHEVNSFDSNYEYYDINDMNHLPLTTGIISDGELTLRSQNTVTCGSSSVIAVGKGSLSIKFKGTIRICFGSLGSSGDRYELRSDGNELFEFSDFFFERSTTLTVLSLSDETSISHFVYTTSKC